MSSIHTLCAHLTVDSHDARDMYFQLVGIYERSNKHSEADECYLVCL